MHASQFAYFAVLLLAGLPAAARERVEGPVLARVLKVQDGDTLLVSAKVWPGHDVRVHVRIRGIDAPETKARCHGERIAARLARERLAELVKAAPLYLTGIQGGKYFGRVLADVRSAGGVDLAEDLLRENLVRPYRGRKRQDWCGKKERAASLVPRAAP